MQGINTENIVFMLIAVLVLWAAVKFLKGVIKIVIALILIFTVGFSSYNIFFVGKPISYELNRYKKDTSYFLKTTSINKEAYIALQEIKENDKSLNISIMDLLFKK